jgi:hypothetical protein
MAMDNEDGTPVDDTLAKSATGRLVPHARFLEWQQKRRAVAAALPPPSDPPTSSEPPTRHAAVRSIPTATPGHER